MTATKTPPAAPPEQTPVNVLSPEYQIKFAKQLERERGEHLVKIHANRDMLRQMKKLGALNEEQSAWLDKFYPEREQGQKRSRDEIDATRAIKAEARGVKTRKGKPTEKTAA